MINYLAFYFLCRTRHAANIDSSSVFNRIHFLPFTSNRRKESSSKSSVSSKLFASRLNLVTTPLWPLLLRAFNRSKSVVISYEPSFNQNRLFFKSSQAPRWAPCYERVRLRRLIITCFDLYNDITHNNLLKCIKLKKCS